MPIPWMFRRDFSFEHKNFAKIYRFYVIETPVPGTSFRSKSFKERGINMKSLNSAMKKATPFLTENWFTVAKKEVESCCVEHGIFYTVDLPLELVIHTQNNKHCTGKTDSLFYAIRCAFAHGAFDLHRYDNEIYYVLENRDGNALKARMILKENTLLKWIDIVNEAPKPSKQSKRKHL